MRRLAKRSANSARRAWRPRLRTLMTVSLLVAPLTDDEVIAGATLDDGAYALRAARICAGDTGGVLLSVAGGCVTARSIALRRTSNRERTSPVCAAIFLERRVSVGNGRNRCTSTLEVELSGKVSDLSRDCRMERSC